MQVSSSAIGTGMAQSKLRRLCQAGKQARTDTGVISRAVHRQDRETVRVLHRLFQGQHAAVVSPYGSVLAFYTSELQCHQDSVGHHKYVPAGAGRLYLIAGNGQSLLVRSGLREMRNAKRPNTYYKGDSAK